MTFSRRSRLVAWGTAVLLGWLPAHAAAQEFRSRGGVEFEWRAFPGRSLNPGQTGQDVSVVFTGEFSLGWNRRDHLLTFEPYGRVDHADGRRTHFDFRTLAYERAWRDVELRAGLRRVFWGVTESRHLVDIVNQTDLVENPDGEDKLGQPMINVAWFSRAGTIDLFLLTGFRQPTFPGTDGRLRAPLVVDPDRAVFEDGGLTRHLGWAVRWSQTLGGWDIGVSHFNALARDPRLEPAIENGVDGTLVPYYDRIHQTGLDLQLTSGGWLWKFEGITRTGGPTGRESAMVGGVEYTIPQIFSTSADLGLLAEVLLDSRDTEPLQNDIFVGGRLALNDVRSTELLAGAIVDRQSGAMLLNLEASRRLSGSWSVRIEARGFAKAPTADPLYTLRRDDYLSLSLTRWF